MDFRELDLFMFQNGGKQPKAEEQISGRYVRGVARPEETDVNAELEKNEFIKYPDGEISQVDPKGNSHAQGGELMNLPPETKILSDNIEIGDDLKDKLNEVFGLKLKKTITFAKAMEAVRKAIGMEEILKKMEAVLSQIKKNNEVRDPDTKRVNEQFLATKLYELEQEKKSKTNTESQVFELLFETQEARKQAEEQGHPEHQNIRKRPPVEQPTQEEMVQYQNEKQAKKASNLAMVGQKDSGAESQPIPVMVENGGRIVTLHMSGGEIFADDYNDMEAVQIQAASDGYETLEEFLIGGEVDSFKDGGGIPERYKKRGFTKVGVKKRASSGAKHKWEVLARKKVGGKTRYKIVKGGYRGMQDFKSHKDSKRRKRFWDRMGGKNSAKAKDPFSPLYWHKRFGTWEQGGQIPTPVLQDADDFSKIFGVVINPGFETGYMTRDFDVSDEEFARFRRENYGYKYVDKDGKRQFKLAKDVTQGLPLPGAKIVPASYKTKDIGFSNLGYSSMADAQQFANNPLPMIKILHEERTLGLVPGTEAGNTGRFSPPGQGNPIQKNITGRSFHDSDIRYVTNEEDAIALYNAGYMPYSQSLYREGFSSASDYSFAGKDVDAGLAADAEMARAQMDGPTTTTTPTPVSTQRPERVDTSDYLNGYPPGSPGYIFASYGLDIKDYQQGATDSTSNIELATALLTHVSNGGTPETFTPPVLQESAESTATTISTTGTYDPSVQTTTSAPYTPPTEETETAEGVESVEASTTTPDASSMRDLPMVIRRKDEPLLDEFTRDSEAFGKGTEDLIKKYENLRSSFEASGNSINRRERRRLINLLEDIDRRDEISTVTDDTELLFKKGKSGTRRAANLINKFKLQDAGVMKNQNAITNETSEDFDLEDLSNAKVVGTSPDGQNIYEIPYKGQVFNVTVGQPVTYQGDDGTTYTFTLTEEDIDKYDFDLDVIVGQETGLSGGAYQQTTGFVDDDRGFGGMQKDFEESLDAVFADVASGELQVDANNKLPLSLNLTGRSSSRPMTGPGRNSTEINELLYNLIQKDPSLEGKIGFDDGTGKLVTYNPADYYGATKEEQRIKDNELYAKIKGKNAVVPRDIGKAYLDGIDSEDPEALVPIGQIDYSALNDEQKAMLSDIGNQALAINRIYAEENAALIPAIEALNEKYGTDLTIDNFIVNKEIVSAQNALEAAEELGFDTEKLESNDPDELKKLEDYFGLESGTITTFGDNIKDSDASHAANYLLNYSQSASANIKGDKRLSLAEGKVTETSKEEIPFIPPEIPAVGGIRYLRTPQRIGPDPMMVGPFILPEFERISPIKVSPQSGYQANTKQVGQFVDMLNQQVGSQVGANVANIFAQSDEGINKLMTATNQQNAQFKMQADQMNAQIQQSEAIARANALQGYGAEALQAYDKTLQDRRTYLNTLDEDRLARDKEIRELNVIDAIYPQYTFDPMGNVVFNPLSDALAMGTADNELQKLLLLQDYMRAAGGEEDEAA